MLDSPGNNEQSTDKYSCQLCISWPYRDGFFDSSSPIELPETNAARHQLVQAFAKTWEDPFSALVQMIPKDTDIKPMELSDFPPPKGLRSGSRAVLMGDAYHAMAMCKWLFHLANLHARQLTRDTRKIGAKVQTTPLLTCWTLPIVSRNH